MNSQEKFQLYVYDGDFCLPSVDVDCIKSMLYTAIARVPVQVRILNTFKHCAFYNAPSFVHKNLQFKSFNETVLYLRTLNYTIDGKLTDKQCSEALAMAHLVQSKLKPVVDYVYWLDQRNCDELTTIWFMKALPFPFNYLHIRKLKERANNLMETMYPTENNLDLIKDYLNRMATDCLSALSTRLGTLEYFYGSEPTTLDIIVYAHVAPLLKLPFPSSDITNILSMWPNLKNLLNRIDTAYFPDLSKTPKYLKEEDKAKTTDDDVSYIAILILTVSATSLVLGFAFSKGFISSKVLD